MNVLGLRDVIRGIVSLVDDIIYMYIYLNTILSPLDTFTIGLHVLWKFY